MKRYSIMVRLRGFDKGREIELRQCDSDPEALVEGARRSHVTTEDHYGKPLLVQKYEHVYIRENTNANR